MVIDSLKRLFETLKNFIGLTSSNIESAKNIINDPIKLIIFLILAILILSLLIYMNKSHLFSGLIGMIIISIAILIGCSIISGTLKPVPSNISSFVQQSIESATSNIEHPEQKA